MEMIRFRVDLDFWRILDYIPPAGILILYILWRGEE